MSRGNRGFLSGLALLGLSLLLLGGPAGAQLVASGGAAGEDNLAPTPVQSVMADTMTVAGAQAIEVSWTLSPSDFVRQQPAGSDPTSGGTFTNVNDVAQYRITRITLAPADTTEVGTAGAGETSIVDSDLSGITGSLKYVVTVADASGNQSAGTTSAEVSLAPAGQAQVGVPGGTLGLQGRIELDMTLPDGLDDQAALLAALRAAVCQMIRLDEPSFNCAWLINGRLSAGSVVFDYEISPLAGLPAGIIAQINQTLASNPGALSDIDPDLGTVTQSSATQGTSINLGTVAPNATASRTITVGNNSSDPQSVVAGTVQVTGAGYSVTPATFSAAQGQSASILVTFRAADVANINGTYTGVVAIASNDTAHALTIVTLTASITAGVNAAQLTVSPVAANFATTEVDSTETLTLTLENTGGVALTGTIGLTGSSAFSVSESSLNIAAHGSLAVLVHFTPTDTVAYTGTITITSNDRVRPTVTVSVLGTGVPAGFAPALPGDFDNNGVVDFDDFFLFADAFGTTTSSSTWDVMFDLQPDGVVNFDDFFLFADAFGTHL